MSHERRIQPLLAVTALLTGLLGGCYAAETSDALDERTIELDLAEPDGGFEESDEPPAFGMEETFARLDVLEADTPVADEVTTTAEYTALRARPEVRRIAVAIVWGRIPADFRARRPRNWDGVVRIDRGALRVRAALRFEGRTDELLPRPDPRTVAFRSTTLPHHDGLLLTALVPDGEPAAIRYVAASPGVEAGAGLQDLLDGPVELLSDELGNRMIAAAIDLDGQEDRCDRGFVLGVWHGVRDGLGVTFGRVVGAGGRLLGHSRGIYGVRRDGARVHFAKIVDRAGRFRAVAVGTYGDGRFQAALRARGGERGWIRGHYRAARGDEAMGFYLGRWQETTCGPSEDDPTPQPMPVPLPLSDE